MFSLLLILSLSPFAHALSVKGVEDATPPPVTFDVIELKSRLNACLVEVKTEFEGGPVLPSRSYAAAQQVGVCTVELTRADTSMLNEFTALQQSYRGARIRLDAIPDLVTPITVKDSWMEAQLERARVEQEKDPEQTADLDLVASAPGRLASLMAGTSAVDVLMADAEKEKQRYMDLRDMLWLAECRGELELPFGEIIPSGRPSVDPRTRCNTLEQKMNTKLAGEDLPLLRVGLQ